MTDFRVHVHDSIVDLRVNTDGVFVHKAYKMHLLCDSADDEDWIELTRVMSMVDTCLCNDNQDVARRHVFDLLEEAMLMSEPELHEPAKKILVKTTRQLNDSAWKQLDVLRHSVRHNEPVESRALAVLAARQPERKRKRKERNDHN